MEGGKRNQMKIMKSKLAHKPLGKNSRIAIISPAGAVKASDLEGTLDLLREEGFEPVLGQYALGEHEEGYLYSGSIKNRLEDLNWALNEESIDAVWATRGGYGCQHLLKGIQLDPSLRRPKWYVGYSDNTAIHSYLLKKGWNSINGQTIKTSSFQVDPKSYQLIFDVFKGIKPNYLVEGHELNKKGEVEGVIVGGNLALVYALLGSPYSFDFQDKILFLEEIGEEYYALDRMITSLELAGAFGQIKGLIVGGMTSMGKKDQNKNYESFYDPYSYELIASRLESYDIPMLFGFPNGHIFDNRPLIIGSEVKLKVDSKCKIEFL